MELRFKPFGRQEDFLFCDKRVRGAFAGKRGGKTEICSVASLMLQEDKPNYKPNGVDPYLGIIAAPTFDMLRRLSWKKFNAYAKHFIQHQTKNPMEIEWKDHNPDQGHESLIYGISADKSERLEGLKANWIWNDEVFQVKEQFFLECLARLSDQEGYLICTGSLGVQFINPKLHWAHYYFKEHPDQDTGCFEWSTKDNPYFPQAEIEKLKNKLDPQTFRAMFELNWDVTPRSAVYSNFNEANIMENYTYNDKLPTYVCVDWGWAHPMAVGWFQYDERKDTVYLFDEIVKSSMTLQQLYAKIKAKPYRIDGFYCDIAGNQEREQTGISNVKWFREKGIHFKYRAKAINYGIPIVRSYIKNSVGRTRFYVASQCKKSIDGIKQYRYPEKDGIITKDLPLKENDDAVDMIRYFFHNRLDSNYGKYKSSVARIR